MRLFKWMMVAGIVALAVWGAKGLVPKAKSAWLLYEENERLAEELRGAKQLEQELGERIAALEDPRVIEQQARVRLQLRRPGERLVVIVPAKEAVPATTSTAADSATGVRGWWAAFIQQLASRIAL